MAIYLGENRVANAHASPTLISKNITSNGTYAAASDGADGYSSVDVNVAGGSDIEDALIARTISTYDNSRITKIGDYAFANCQKLTTVNFSACTSIGSNAFYDCYSLATISFPNCTEISTSAFYACSSLTTISFPNCISMGNYAFANCQKLTTVNFPTCTLIPAGAFSACYSLTSISFPNCASISFYAFASCRSLATVSFSKCTSIGSSAFRSCWNLISLYLTGSTIPTLGASVFYSTPIGGYSAKASRYGSIYVPASLYNSYLTATNWSLYSSRFVSM